jgi:hypothetical protein
MAARKMVKLKVEETSGVDHPAHLAEGWIVMKAAKETPMASAKKPKMSKEDMVEDEEMAMSKEDMADDEMESEDEEMDFEVEFNKMREERDMYKQRLDEMEKGASAEDEEDAMMKAAPAAVRVALTKARQEAEQAREALRKEVEARRDSQFVAKAASWSALSLDADEVGPALRRLSDIDRNLADAVTKALSSANAQADAANIFAELGTPLRPDSGDAYSKMQRMAKAAVDAGEHKTVEQALSSLVTTHPELYEAYRAEQAR